ncbi:aquaporin-like protein, partial [Piptocephalis cylindrospora]
PFVKRIRWAYRPYLAEFLGTLVFTALTAGLVSNYQLQIAKGHMTYFGETFYSGIALMYAIYVAGGVSGGHINPAITLLFAVWRGFPWRKVPGYWFAQFFGAFCGAGIVYLMYLPHYELANMGERNIIGPYETGSIFATVPSQVRGNYSCFFGEIVGSAILGAAIFAFIDRYNIPPTYLAPIAIGLAQGVIYAGISSPGRLFLNPARDFGSRVLLAAAGYGGEVFSAYDGYMWIPIVGPMIGTVTGGALYDFFIVTG